MRIKNIMEVQQIIVSDIKTTQLFWYEHVLRMAEDRLSKEIIKWVTQDTKKRGRLRKSCRYGIVEKYRQEKSQKIYDGLEMLGD